MARRRPSSFQPPALVRQSFRLSTYEQPHRTVYFSSFTASRFSTERSRRSTSARRSTIGLRKADRVLQSNQECRYLFATVQTLLAAPRTRRIRCHDAFRLHHRRRSPPKWRAFVRANSRPFRSRLSTRNDSNTRARRRHQIFELYDVQRPVRDPAATTRSKRTCSARSTTTASLTSPTSPRCRPRRPERRHFA